MGLALHPLFSSCFEEEELQQLRLVDSIKQYCSQETIFEINTSNRDLSNLVMRAKWHKDCKAIARFQQGRQEQQEGLAGPAQSCPMWQAEQPGKEEEEEEKKEEEEEEEGESMEDVFTEVMGQK
uniref:Uncharacterized protein n=1 Tax=Myotis myotis TaxID=51298 RepID=A0A7J7RMR9_MYOMY|nr:hypothetical protein mMyoMyo1_010267 [Myotis myotis]